MSGTKRYPRARRVYWIIVIALILTTVVLGGLTISDYFAHKFWYTDQPTEVEALQAEFNFTLPPGWRLTRFATVRDYGVLSSIKMEGPIVPSFELTEYFHCLTKYVHITGPNGKETFTFSTPEFEGSLYVVRDNGLCNITIAKEGLQNTDLLNGLAVVKKRGDVRRENHEGNLLRPLWLGRG